MLPAQQCPQYPLLQPLLATAISAVTTAQDAEAVRTEQADAEKTAFETAKALSRRAINALVLKYIKVALLESWGVEVVGTGTQTRTHVPQSREEIIHMLNRYIIQEDTLPAEQRITTPTLSEIIAARDALVNAYAQRVRATSTRELAINQRREAAQMLLRLLQLVAFHHVTIDFGGVVDQNLQRLGYDVVTIRATSRPNGNGDNTEL